MFGQGSSWGSGSNGEAWYSTSHYHFDRHHIQTLIVLIFIVFNAGTDPQWALPLVIVLGQHHPNSHLSTPTTLEVGCSALVIWCLLSISDNIYLFRLYESRNAESNAGVHPPIEPAPPLWSCRARNSGGGSPSEVDHLYHYHQDHHHHHHLYHHHHQHIQFTITITTF